MFVVAKSEQDKRWLGRHRLYSIRKSSIAKASTAELDAALRQQNNISAKVRQSFLDAVNRIGDSIDTEQLSSLLAQGRTDEAIALVNQQLSAQGFQPIANAITSGAVSAATVAARTANVAELTGGAHFSFSATNPEAINFLRTYEMGLIRSLTAEARASVSAAIREGFTAGRNPLDVARDVRKFIGLTESQTQAVNNFRAALEGGTRDALSRALRDRRFDSSVANAASGGRALTVDQIDNMVSRYAARYLKYRSETIARTEATRAMNTGNYQLWKQMVNSGQAEASQITRTWITAGDHKVRDSHSGIDGDIVEGMDKAFDTELGPLMYPGDSNGDAANTINCRCTVFYRVKPQSSKE